MSVQSLGAVTGPKMRRSQFQASDRNDRRTHRRQLLDSEDHARCPKNAQLTIEAVPGALYEGIKGDVLMFISHPLLVGRPQRTSTQYRPYGNGERESEKAVERQPGQDASRAPGIARATKGAVGKTLNEGVYACRSGEMAPAHALVSGYTVGATVANVTDGGFTHDRLRAFQMRITPSTSSSSDDIRACATHSLSSFRVATDRVTGQRPATHEAPVPLREVFDVSTQQRRSLVGFPSCLTRPAARLGRVGNHARRHP